MQAEQDITKKRKRKKRKGGKGSEEADENVTDNASQMPAIDSMRHDERWPLLRIEMK